MTDQTRARRRELRELAELAYARELSEALKELAAQFAAWDRGERGVHELSDQIHRFHDGISRRLYNFYVGGEPEPKVAAAVANGVLSEDEVGPEVLHRLRRQIEFYAIDRDAEEPA